ncbi:MAG: hypothetical protein COB53_10635 [Elusimicrobia bacterium]|nr:MAG: hypothetical protein COB53_10635 [Elusimicrobiota bacterium]
MRILLILFIAVQPVSARVVSGRKIGTPIALSATIPLGWSPAAAQSASLELPSLTAGVLPVVAPISLPTQSPAVSEVGRQFPKPAVRRSVARVVRSITKHNALPNPGAAPKLYGMFTQFWSGQAPRFSAEPVSLNGADAKKPGVTLQRMKKFAPISKSEPDADPYEPLAVMPKGKYAGQKIDTSERRALTILRGEAAAPFAPKDGEIVAANFRHDGKFWIVKLPADAVERVIFEKWDFGEKQVRLSMFGKTLLDFELFHVAHTELRFKFRDGSGATLYPQRSYAVDEVVQAVGEPLQDIVNSIEAVSIPGVAFSVWGGLTNQFVASRRFKSLRENYYERVTRERRHVEQWDLLMDDDRKRKLFNQAVLESDEDGLRTMYHLFRHSCTTEAFRLIDSVMNYGIRTWRTFFKRMPQFPELYLWARGLLKPGGKSRMKPLGLEKEEWREVLRERMRSERDERKRLKKEG